VNQKKEEFQENEEEIDDDDKISDSDESFKNPLTDERETT